MNDFAPAIGNQSLQPTAQLSRSHVPLIALESLRAHWPEYLMEASGIASSLFLVCAFASLVLHPGSPVRHFIHDPLLRRALIGVLTGSSVVAIVMTPWGQQSGGHFNPAMTLTFYRLGKMAFWDMLFYVAAQFAGAVSGVGIAAYVCSEMCQQVLLCDTPSRCQASLEAQGHLPVNWSFLSS